MSSSRKNALECTHDQFFTFSRTQPLHYSHLNTEFLIAKLQANLAQNKANTWLNKFNLTISPFGVEGSRGEERRGEWLSFTLFGCF